MIYAEDGGEFYGAIDGILTNGAKDTLLYAPTLWTGEVVIPVGVTAIGDNAFSIEDTILEWDDNPNYGKGKFDVVYDRDDSTKDIPTPSDPKRVFEFSEKAQKKLFY